MYRVTMGHLGVIIGHPRVTIGHLRVTIGHIRVTMGYLRVTIGHPRVTIGHLRATMGHLRLTIGHLRVTIGYFFYSKHKANTTELHPKVRQTCLKPKLVITVITGLSTYLLSENHYKDQNWCHQVDDLTNHVDYQTPAAQVSVG